MHLFPLPIGTYHDVQIIKHRHKIVSNDFVNYKNSINYGKKNTLYGISCNVCPVLIVVPPAVLYNWKREIDTWGCFDVSGEGVDDIFSLRYFLRNIFSLCFFFSPKVGILGGENGDKTSKGTVNYIFKKRNRSQIIEAASINEIEIVLTTYNLFTKYVNNSNGEIEKENLPKCGLKNINWSCKLFFSFHLFYSGIILISIRMYFFWFFQRYCI